jgi:hypothetical protein
MMKMRNMATKQQPTQQCTLLPTNMITATLINQQSTDIETQTTSMTPNDATGTIMQASESFINFNSICIRYGQTSDRK